MTWNQERIDALRNIIGPPVTSSKADLLDALDEIERLRAELNDKHESDALDFAWDSLTQEQRAELRAKGLRICWAKHTTATITDRMLARGTAAAAAVFREKAERTPWNKAAVDVPHGALLDGVFDLVEVTRAALGAALNPEEQP